jgi:hypothetical protein
MPVLPVGEDMSNHSTQDTSTLDLAIEDAVLFGNTEELDDILDLIEGDEGFPDNLRHGLEALRYFRSYYGKDGELSSSHPLKKQKIALMESAWGAELLDQLRRGERANAVRFA